jgi:hypothetical protein
VGFVEALGAVEPLGAGVPLLPGVGLGVRPLGTIDGMMDSEGDGLGDGEGVATAAHSVPGR